MSSETNMSEDADKTTLDDLNSSLKQVDQKSQSDHKNITRERKISTASTDCLDENVNDVYRSNKKLRMTKFLKKYFLEGQKLSGVVHTETEENVPVWKRVVSSRRFWGIIIPLTFFEVCCIETNHIHNKLYLHMNKKVQTCEPTSVLK